MPARWSAITAIACTWICVMVILLEGALSGDAPGVTPAAAATRAAATAEPPPRPDGPSRSVSVAWVGDITPGSRYGLPPDDGRALFAGVRDALRADVVLGNLEGTLSVGGVSKCGTDGGACFSFQAPPANADALRWAGFDLVNLANNHAFDFGAAGQAQTVDALEDAGVAHTGRPGQVTTLEHDGMRLAVVGVAPYPWSTDSRDLAAVAALVRAAVAEADVVIVLAHLGTEGSGAGHVPVGTEALAGEDRGDTRALAHTAIEAGADAVLASGPHVLRGMELHAGKPIAYSLGNFAGYHNFSTAGALGSSGVLRLDLTPGGGWLGGRFTSLRLDAAGVPALDPAGLAAAAVTDLGRADFGADAIVVGRDGRLGIAPTD